MNRQKPILIFQNNSDTSQPVSLFSTSPARAGGINGVNYQWNLSSLGFTGLVSVSIQVGMVGSALAPLTAPVRTATLQGIADGLNTLGVGFFYVSGSSIRTSNRSFTYGNMTVSHVPFTFTATGLVQVPIAGITSASLVTVDSSTGQPLVSNTHSGASPFIMPVTGSSTPSAENLNEGDIISSNLVVTPAAAYNVNTHIFENGNPIVARVDTGSNILYQFPYLPNAVYTYVIIIT